jgi:membrane protein YdbS with pleckstrin-like domain
MGASSAISGKDSVENCIWWPIRLVQGWLGRYSLAVQEPVAYTQLDPKAVSLWRLQGLVRLALVGIPASVLLALLLGSASHWVLGVAGAAALFCFGLLKSIFWPPFSWRAYGYVLRESEVLVRSGVLFRRWTSIPYQRIQHLDTRQGPIERMLGLARLQIYTASGMSADGSIPGLAQATAEGLRDLLSKRGGDDGV